MGCPHRGEDHPDHREGLPDRHPHDLPGRFGRGADHRPGRHVPRPPWRREDLPHPGARVRGDPAGVRAVRAVGGRWRLHPRVLRLRGDGGRQRVHVPGQPADGRDGGQGEDHAGGDGRGPDALHRVRVRPPPRGRQRRTRSRPSAATCPTCPSNWQQQPGGARGGRAGGHRPGRAGPGQRAAGLRHAALCARAGGRRLVLRDPRAVGQGTDDRVRPAGRPGHRGGREQPAVQGRRAVRGLRRQGHPVHPALRRVQRAAAVPL